MSFFDSIDLFPEDSIFNLTTVYSADSHPDKVNLGVGTYRDSEGNPIVLNCVRKAEALILEQALLKEYQPMEGDHEFSSHLLALLFGKESCHRRISATQTIGATGALRLGAEFLAQEISRTIHISNPSWPNHLSIFERVQMSERFYPYFDKQELKLDFSGMCQAIAEMTPGSVILLHGCCHNPTGIDPTFEQWKELSSLIKEQKVIPLFDMAYHGFGISLEEDAKAVRYFYEQGHEMLLAYSCSKNFGLYGERVGMLAIATHHEETALRVTSQIKQLVRSMYSTPPLQGARIVATILRSKELTLEWEQELKAMRDRVFEMRRALIAELFVQSTETDFSFLHNQLGLFSFCGLSPEQVSYLANNFGIFMPSSGRINVAGLNSRNLAYVVKAFLAARSL